MTHRTGNIFDHTDDYEDIFVPTCGVLNSSTCLVMGTGAAHTAKTREENLPCIFGETIFNHGRCDPTGQWYEYFVILPGWSKIGAIQSKRHWRDPSTMPLVVRSLAILRAYHMVMKYPRWGIVTPGVGLGGLPFEMVNDHLHTWEADDSRHETLDWWTLT